MHKALIVALEGTVRDNCLRDSILPGRGAGQIALMEITSQIKITYLVQIDLDITLE